MGKTAIQTSIEKAEFRLSLEMEMLQASNKPTARDIHHTRISCMEKEIFELRSLLPTERQVIEAAFDEGQEMEYQYHINSEPRTTASDYYQQTYSQTDKTEHNGKD